jgi:serine/threonine protein kinase/Flp pilus assembly protein TadD
MSELRTCPLGHQWEAADEALADGRTSTCPVCASVSATLPANDVSQVQSLPASQVPRLVGAVEGETLAASRATPVNLAIASTVAGYEILGTLGRGAMGVVYRARQCSLNRVVALKVIQSGAHATAEQLARFRLEAEILAGLQHPNIVQIYEVGEHNGRPFLALEFVDGGSLDRRLAGKPLQPGAAALLVETLARAMHSAHQRGIVHRDLKPANILLSSNEIPKITDFGLAKRLEEDRGQTQSGAILGTPSYMAPEQALGQIRDVGPLADVYALGAILYELVSGRPPFLGQTILQTLEQVRTLEPTRLTRLRPRVSVDLETICTTCLAKNPQKRYPSALAMAEDLHRFLSDEPISARPAGPIERTVKWAKRRPTSAALLLVSLIAVTAIVGGSLWDDARLRVERDRAEKDFRSAVRAVDEMLTEVGEEELASQPGAEEKRRRLLEKALTFYQDFVNERSSDPALRDKLGLAYQRNGDILRLLGRSNEAKAAYGQAIETLTLAAAASPAEPDYRLNLAQSYNWLGEVFRTAQRPDQAESAYEQALDLQLPLVNDFPERAQYQEELARIYYNLGILQADTAREKSAQQTFRAAIKVLEKLTAERNEPTYRQHLARAYLNLGTVLRTEDANEAEACYGKAIRLLRDLAMLIPEKPDYRQELGAVYNNLGNLLRSRHRYQQAEFAHRDALALAHQLAADFRKVPIYRELEANTHNSLGVLLSSTGRMPDAKTEWNEARRLYQALLAQSSSLPDYRAGLGRVTGNLGWLESRLNRWQQFSLECVPTIYPSANLNIALGHCIAVHLQRQSLEQACRLLEEGISHLEAALESNPAKSDYRNALRNQYETLGAVCKHLGDNARARRAEAQVARLRGSSAPAPPRTP